MKIYEMAVKRPVTTIMLILSLVFFGIVSYTRTPVDMLPSMNMPIAVVMTSYDAGPEEVESIVTSNLETAISRVPKVKAIQSSSSDGTSLIVVQFEDDVDMDSSTYKMDQYISVVMPMLPDGVSDPTILSIDPTQIPVIMASVSHDTMTQAELYRYMQSTILPMLESTEGVSSVSLSGGVINHVEITVNQDKLMQYGFAMNSLIQQLQAENVSLPGGITSKGDLNMNLKVDGKFKSIEEIENLNLVSQTTGTSVRLKDMAAVRLTDKEPSSIFRSNGKAGISLTFSKESTANIIETANAIKEKFKEIETQNPGLHTYVTQDQSTFISDSIKNVLDSAIMGVILAVIVLMVFLKDIKTALIVGIAMPVSIIATFTFLYMLNITINLLSLGGLTFAVGMLVDNSIIVIENIFRYIELGESRIEAAIKGTKEVAMAVFASTITNIAIFLPIVFTGGLIGDWLSNLALTITVSLLCSLLVSVTVIPMFAAMFISDNNKIKLNGKIKGSDKYIGGLKWSLNKRMTSVIFAVVFSLISVVFGFTSGLELMPGMDSNSFTISVKTEHGTKLEVIDSYAHSLEERLKQIDYVEDYHTSVGSSGDPLMSSGSLSVTVNTKELSDIGKSANDISKELEKEALSCIPSGSVTVSNNGASAMMGSMSGTQTVTFDLDGLDLQTLKELADSIVDRLQQESYITKVTHSYEEGQPYIHVDIDNDKASLYGLTTATVATSISSYQKGTTATRYSLSGTEIDVTVKTDTNSTESIEALRGLRLATLTGQLIPLSYVAELTEKTSPATINKINKIKSVSFDVEVDGITVGEAQSKITEITGQMAMPSGYKVDFTGATKELMEAMNQMLFAIFVGVVLIYMILAAQFESFKQPLIIMVSIPFSFTGGFLLIAVLRMPMSIPVLMGMLMLIGIIVNNAILIVDTINQFRRTDGMDMIPAIISTCEVRLRPILLTTLTTILGLVPMAIGIGEGTKMLQPLAIFVSGGLIFGTVLTMIIVPVLYLMTDKERKNEKTKKDLLELKK